MTNQSDAPPLPPSCGPATGISTPDLIHLYGEIAGRYAHYKTEVLHNRYLEIRGELLNRFARSDSACNWPTENDLVCAADDGEAGAVRRAWKRWTARQELVLPAPQVVHSGAASNPPAASGGSGLDAPAAAAPCPIGIGVEMAPTPNSADVRRAFMDGIDWEHHLGEDSKGTTLYPSEKITLREKRCLAKGAGCGIVEVEVRLIRWVVEQDLRKEMELGAERAR